MKQERTRKVKADSTKNRRSTYYQFTINGKSDLNGWFRLDVLKNAVAKENGSLTAHCAGNRKRVCVKGRLGRNNATHGHLYRSSGPRAWAMKSGSIKLEHASRFDVYVYDVAKKY